MTPLALTMGEPAGIGPDLIVQLYADRRSLGLPVFAVYGHAGFLAARAARLGLDIEVRAVAAREAAAAFETALPVIDIAGDVDDTPGEPDPNTAPVVVGAIAQAVEAVQAGAFRGVVTAPIHKAALYGAGFEYPGHTEFLAALCAEDDFTPLPVMMLAHDDLRCVPLTIHIPLADVPGQITHQLILDTIRVIARDLAARFGIAAPKIGVAGLNPHAGEDGMIGTEEVETIIPALAALRTEGIDVFGPLSADTLFYPPHWRNYDCVVAMYHDQALIPIKTVAFDAGVNVTLGLPIVRTSPDHGTAFSLAGTGKASPNSMLAAIRLADAIS
ncbi:4-hydroxythreonine-4-phosphate dehydrogenase PdxA [Pelagibacterium halotolerans]|uniref:4-hydroxythreonine-4-phosphate dehydrogenase n=1 Tax=Pelagibacterium halotolerans (strain DSM 22347 / JCM 15775 / CGMCC 1.7692 / B2) TaxID=1082931 RepID=G4RGJ9_PELHB|nr:4-hydroxythreonine-4-phosphate dehydrogenase PdxA [Pelagibacterium halotolerans]AEQ51058.1 4-hydroxythreonine-4-phosphate dehydrogenase [Pelagibacterium halotolerans B2]SEA03634.1 4-hydroxythreonine-4-phosphate dehydrogenase [Pelagibacterium halotolerans]